MGEDEDCGHSHKEKYFFSHSVDFNENSFV